MAANILILGFLAPHAPCPSPEPSVLFKMAAKTYIGSHTNTAKQNYVVMAIYHYPLSLLSHVPKAAVVMFTKGRRALAPSGGPTSARARLGHGGGEISLLSLPTPHVPRAVCHVPRDSNFLALAY